MKKLIGISRVSTMKQFQNGGSIADQNGQIEKFAQANSFQLLKIVQVQASGKKQKLNVGQLSQTIKEAKDLEAELVTTKVDRISRCQISLLLLRRASSESGVEIWITEMNKRISDISDMEFNLIAIMAEEERKAIVSRVRAAMKGRKGVIGISLSPQELAEKSRLKRNALAHQWSRSIQLEKEILDAVSALKVPNLKNVARWLNGEKVFTRRGGRWDGSNLHKQINRLGWSWKELTKV